MVQQQGRSFKSLYHVITGNRLDDRSSARHGDNGRNSRFLGAGASIRYRREVWASGGLTTRRGPENPSKRRATSDCRVTGTARTSTVPMPRSTPDGFRKTSYELTEAAKNALADLTRTLDRDGYPAIAETTVIETLIVTAKRDGVDRDVLDRVMKARKAALDRANRS
jgi:hypothetical protein